MTEKINDEMMDERYYAQEIFDLVRKTPDKKKLANALSYYHDNDIASALSYLTPKERKHLYDSIGIENTSRVFAYLDEDVDKYFAELEAEQAADIIEEMDADDAVDILEGLNDTKAREIIKNLEPEAKEDIELINSYADNQFGSLMTTNYIAIQRGITVKQAMRSLVEQAADNDNLGTIYVLDTDETFYGAITLQDLIIAREYTDLETLVTTSYPYVYDHETVDDCIEQLKDYSEDSIPVLDSDKHLLGVITSQDLVEVVDEEMGEDYAKLAGLTEEEDLNEPLLHSIRKRVPWLLILMLLGLIVSSVVGVFEPVMTTSPTERAELAQKMSADVISAFQAGLLSREEAREELKARGEDLGVYGKIEPEKEKPAEIISPPAEV